MSDPVKAILAISGCSTRAAPASLPNPVTTLTTPGGKPANSNNFANVSVEAEVNSDGLMTTVLPAANAAASFQESNNKGEFHGVIIPITPKGSYRVKLKISALSVGITLPSILSANPP